MMPEEITALCMICGAYMHGPIPYTAVISHGYCPTHAVDIRRQIDELKRKNALARAVEEERKRLGL